MESLPPASPHQSPAWVTGDLSGNLVYLEGRRWPGYLWDGLTLLARGASAPQDHHHCSPECHRTRKDTLLICLRQSLDGLPDSR